MTDPLRQLDYWDQVARTVSEMIDPCCGPWAYAAWQNGDGIAYRMRCTRCGRTMEALLPNE